MIQQSVDLSLDSPIPLPLPAKKSRYLRNFAKGSLVMLLLQPEENLPDVLILDEPELGLHPYAITVVSGLIRAVSTKVQVVVATQSTAFVDCFEPEDIVVVEREGRKSIFRRLGTEVLAEWLGKLEHLA